ncbi:MAG: hypothetical protein SF029_15865 [bacterium]|nr:hypothetical protein [bacterium]
MFPDSTLAHFFLTQDGVLARTETLSPEQIDFWQAQNPVEPMPSGAQAVGLFGPLDDQFGLVRAWGEEKRLYHFVVLPSDIYRGLVDNVRSLLEITTQAVPQDAQAAPLPPLDVPPMPTWTGERRTVVLESVLGRLTSGEMQPLFDLLSAALDERGLALRDFSPDLNARLELVQALMLLLPASTRVDFTFSTNSTRPVQVGVLFTETDLSVEKNQVEASQLATGLTLPEALPVHPYVQLLTTLWQGELKAFAAELRALDVLASQLIPGRDTSLSERLRLVTERYQFDQRVIGEGDVSAAEVRAILRGAAPPEGATRVRYLERLLAYALEERDAEAAEIVTRAMDEDAELDARFNQQLTQALNNEPDAVYSFIRARLSQGLDERWLPRLKAAAAVSLNVAINDADNDTFISWLQLIAREPATYQLSQVLQQGLQAAQKRAHDDGALGHQLLILAARRVPGWVDRLLDDNALLEKLTYPLGPALREGNPEAFTTALALGREIGLVLVARAIHQRTGQVITPANLDFVWGLYNDNSASHVPEPYQPAQLLTRLAENGAAWLPPETQERLLSHSIMAGRVEFYRPLVAQMAQRDNQLALLAAALNNSGFTPESILNVVGLMMGDETITPQQAVNVYLRLIANRAWNRSMQPLIEQAARLIQQNAAITVSPDILWRMLQAANEFRAEGVARASARRLLLWIETLTEDAALAENLNRLHDATTWSASTRIQLLGKWREWVQTQPTSRLQGLAKRLTQEEQDIVSTTLAVRRIVGKRTADEFASAVSTTYNLIQGMLVSFDSENRQGSGFDQAAARAELEAYQAQLSPDARKVVAKNLRELAQMVVTLAENRGRAPRRSGEDAERSLLTGEQSPQNALDALRWMSGYFDGLQQSEDGGE